MAAEPLFCDIETPSAAEVSSDLPLVLCLDLEVPMPHTSEMASAVPVLWCPDLPIKMAAWLICASDRWALPTSR